VKGIIIYIKNIELLYIKIIKLYILKLFLVIKVKVSKESETSQDCHNHFRSQIDHEIQNRNPRPNWESFSELVGLDPQAFVGE